LKSCDTTHSASNIPVYCETKLTYNKTSNNRNRNWQGDIIPNYIIPILEELRRRGIKPTVRGMCYILESKGAIKKTPQEFINATRALGRARKNYQIPIDSFADNSRTIIKNFRDSYQTIYQKIDTAINYLKNLHITHKEDLPRWYNQPKYVEVWIEKEAMADTLESILRDRNVVIVPNRGWASITYVYENILRLKDKFANDSRIKEAWVLYFGDFDPSGMRMDEIIKRELSHEIGTRVHFKRIAITPDQVNDYNLKHLTNPDPQVIATLRKNPNASWFENRYGSLFQIELDALQSLPEFENLVVNAVDELFDEDIYHDFYQNNSFEAEEINAEIKQRIEDEFGFRIIDENGDID
jgi:hypothetical protein